MGNYCLQNKYQEKNDQFKIIIIDAPKKQPQIIKSQTKSQPEIVVSTKQCQNDIIEQQIHQITQSKFTLPSLSNQILQTLLKSKFYNKYIQLLDNKSATHLLFSDQRLYYGILPTNQQQQLHQSQTTNIGSFYMTDHSYYIGQIFQLKANGIGIYIFNNGANYQGQFKNDMPDGYGKFVNQNYTYIGQIQKGIPHGYGKLISKDQTFEGQFQNGKKLSGQLIWLHESSNCLYVGEFCQQKFHGQGILQTKMGKYTGKFQNGKKHGFGIFQWNQGQKFQGQYKQNVKSGYGQLYDGEGNPQYKGIWQNDIPISGLKFQQTSPVNTKIIRF